MKALVLAVALCLSTRALADGRAIARGHFQRGQEHLAAGRLDAAIGEYHAAYDAAPIPGLLFFLGQAYRLKGERRMALGMYEKFLAAQPSSGPIAEAQRYVAALTAELEAEREMHEATSDPSPAPPPPVEEPAPPPAPIVVAGPMPSGPPIRPGHTLRVAGFVSGGAGIAGLGGALYFWARARSIAGELSAPHATWTADLDRKAREDLPAARRNTWLFGAAGGVALVGGGVLLVLAARRDRDVTLVPAPLPGGAGAALVGRF